MDTQLDQLPEYLRDYYTADLNRENFYNRYVFEQQEPLFSLEEIAQQDVDYIKQALTGDPFNHTIGLGYKTTHEIMEEYDRQEKLGTNSWLDGQPYGPGVSHPRQDSSIRLIKRLGYNDTIREKRPSLIFKSVLSEMKNSRGDQKVDLIKALLKKMNLDPSYFVKQVYQYKK